ncbi:hypothetical protein O181_122223 [Austropuccinia psidii MF-1]|uniref:Uncharacterized protein n=1 Tax=Austropuccinia psidii MF-1 TaxID=1389203 RepID=A0A9Q3KJ06_9BASI|nr:hypothetical protein [Austropuccinia psidii MF-1]
MAINHHGPQIGQGPPRTTFQPMDSGSHQRPPDQLSSILPHSLRGSLPIPPCTPYSRLQEWCIYGIIYHYAPFLHRNSMVMFSGPNSMIPNRGPKIECPFRRRTLQLISLAIHGGYQKTIQGPQAPGSAGVGLKVQLSIIQREISQGYYIISISFQGRKYFSIPWEIQLVHTGNAQVSCMTLAQWGQFSPTVQFSRWPELYWRNPDNTAGDSPSRISPSALHIYWPPFITWGLFPS